MFIVQLEFYLDKYTTSRRKYKKIKLINKRNFKYVNFNRT